MQEKVKKLHCKAILEVFFIFFVVIFTLTSCGGEETDNLADEGDVVNDGELSPSDQDKLIAQLRTNASTATAPNDSKAKLEKLSGAYLMKNPRIIDKVFNTKDPECVKKMLFEPNVSANSPLKLKNGISPFSELQDRNMIVYIFLRAIYTPDRKYGEGFWEDFHRSRNEDDLEEKWNPVWEGLFNIQLDEELTTQLKKKMYSRAYGIHEFAGRIAQAFIFNDLCYPLNLLIDLMGKKPQEWNWTSFVTMIGEEIISSADSAKDRWFVDKTIRKSLFSKMLTTIPDDCAIGAKDDVYVLAILFASLVEHGWYKEAELFTKKFTKLPLYNEQFLNKDFDYCKVVIDSMQKSLLKAIKEKLSPDIINYLISLLGPRACTVDLLKTAIAMKQDDIVIRLLESADHLDTNLLEAEEYGKCENLISFLAKKYNDEVALKNQLAIIKSKTKSGEFSKLLAAAHREGLAAGYKPKAIQIIYDAK